MTDIAATLTPLTSLIADGRLYPSVVLHGAGREQRLAAALHLARTVLCEGPSDRRPCGECSHCRRISLADDDHFHPDFHPLVRDRPTVTSAAAVRGWVAEAHLAPFEARAKVFALLEAETLGPDAADVLLKVLEEPPGEAARHFLLLAANDRELPATIRSRSMSFYLGSVSEEPEQERAIAQLDAALATARAERAPRLAQAILDLDDWKDPRSARGWQVAARALVEIAGRGNPRWLLDLAGDLLEAPRLRIRGIPAARIVEGAVAGRIPSSAE